MMLRANLGASRGLLARRGVACKLVVGGSVGCGAGVWFAAGSECEQKALPVVEASQVDEKPMTEEEIQEAINCPCMDSMRNSPCGPQFMASFECFLRSKENAQGADCLELFYAMKGCFDENQEYYEKLLAEDEDAASAMSGTPRRKKETQKRDASPASNSLTPEVDIVPGL